MTEKKTFGGKQVGAGRPKGSKDKVTRNLKQLVLDTAAKLEKDKKSLYHVAKENPQWFYANFVKPMLPKDVTIAGDEDKPLIYKIERVIVDNSTDKDS